MAFNNYMMWLKKSLALDLTKVRVGRQPNFTFFCVILGGFHVCYIVWSMFVLFVFEDFTNGSICATLKFEGKGRDFNVDVCIWCCFSLFLCLMSYLKYILFVYFVGIWALNNLAILEILWFNQEVEYLYCISLVFHVQIRFKYRCFII